MGRFVLKFIDYWFDNPNKWTDLATIWTKKIVKKISISN